ncbi:MAG: hypothetical protein NC900_04150 [Candidatus Omnitrophica bacterium]|nr:hypothetical protein [Candidatus Omnitrophota bacterium]
MRPFLWSGEALLLLALGLGYIVLYLAKREEKGLQFLGYVVGTFIILLSIFYILINIFIGIQISRPIRTMMMQRKGGLPSRVLPQQKAPTQ